MEDLKAHLHRRGLGPGAPRHVDFALPKKEQKRKTHGTHGTLVAMWLDDILVAIAVLAGAIAAVCAWWIVAFALTLAACGLLRRVMPPRRRSTAGVTIVCISDTHGRHRDLDLPPGDVLIHAGDFTKFSLREDAEDFNRWLAEQPFKHKVVVNGNHEHNADWQREVQSILSNAIVLKNSACSVCGLSVFGADFCWPMRTESPIYAQIPKGTDIVIAHGPASGYVDSGHGCSALLWAMGRVRPRLVVSGHIHDGHGLAKGRGALRGTTFVNAANCCDGYSIGWPPISLTV
mmetsp:Transcript_16837/g.39090  ORF Transcript_16837/g.39090 Transcript_16837/m.39090 type:complete len:289 (+) Transcript_16837:39-905(+)